MRRATGRGGELFMAGDPVRCTFTLQDCGTGFDWRAASPSYRFWGEQMSFQVHDGGIWRPEIAVEVLRGTGRVSFGRSFANHPVQGEGTVLPLSKVGQAEHWEMTFRLDVATEPVLGGVVPQVGGRPSDYSATLYGTDIDDVFREEIEGRQLYVLLPFGSGAAFWGLGMAADRQTSTLVTFNEGGVHYDPV